MVYLTIIIKIPASGYCINKKLTLHLLKQLNKYNMKKLFILAVIAGAFSMTSCKKDFTCECTVSGQTTPIELKNVKKVDATAACKTWNTSYSAQGGSCKLK